MIAASALAVPYSSRLCSSRTSRPTLPPKQSADHQVEFGGEFCLACGGGPGIGTHHQQATFRKRPQIPAGEMTEPAPDPVAHDRPSDSPAYHEADPGRLIVFRLAQEVTRHQPAPCAVAAPHRPREL